MSQQLTDDFNIDPLTTSGTELASILNRLNSAVLSMQSGTSRPDYAVQGFKWLDVADTLNIEKFFTGSTDLSILEYDTVNNVAQINGGAGFTDTGKAIKNKSSTTASAVPLPADVQPGEILINRADKKLFFKDSSNEIVSVRLGVDAINVSNEAQTKLGDLDLGQNISVASWSYSGTTITINTSSIHNLSVGDSFYVSGLVATTNAPNGKWVVATVVDTDTITFTATSTPTGTPTVSSAILVSGITSISATEWLNDGVDIGGGEILYPDGTIYGSNANGEYTKYPNGDLICTFTDTVAQVSDSVLNNIYYDSTPNSLTYPHAFVSTPVATVSAKISVGRTWADIGTHTNTNITIIILGNNAVASGYATYIAKGRWK